jgi:hypothetical protein
MGTHNVWSGNRTHLSKVQVVPYTIVNPGMGRMISNTGEEIDLVEISTFKEKGNDPVEDLTC